MAANLAGLSLLAGLLSIVLISWAVAMLTSNGQVREKFDLLGPYLWLIPVSLTCTGLYELVGLWATRRKAFGSISRSLIQQSVFGNVAKMGLGAAGFQPMGLLIGQIVSQGSGILYLARDASSEVRPLIKTINVRRMKSAMLSYWKFPVFLVPAQLLSIGASQAPVLFVVFQFDAETTGSFGLAMTVIALPTMLIAKSISRAFYGNVAELGRSRSSEIYALSIGILKRILAISVPVAIITLLVSKKVFPIVFGEEWRLAGEAVSALSLFLLGALVFASLDSVLNVFHRQDIKLGLDVQRAILVGLLFVVAHQQEYDFIAFVWLFSIVMLVHFAASTLCVLLFLRRASVSKNQPEN